MHVEDVVIEKDYRSIGLGRVVMNYIKCECADPNDRIYKIILECSENNEGFYLKSQYRRAGLSMRYDMESQ